MKGLRFSAVLITGTVLAVSSLAHATTPGKAATTFAPAKGTGSAGSSSVKSSSTPAGVHSTSSPLSIDALAKVEGILSYCVTVDPANASLYKQAQSNITSGHASSELKNDQGSSRYVSALGALNAELAALPASTVISSCQNFLAGK